MRKRQRTRGSSGQPKRVYAAVGLFIVLVIGWSISTGAFSLADVARMGQVDVVSDGDAELGLWVNETVQNCERQDLVEVTNKFNERLDVTVSLNDGSIGTLYVTSPGDSGNSVTFGLNPGASEMVELDADYTGVTPTSFSFDITGSGDVTYVEATRSSTLDGPSVCGGGGPPGA